MVERRPVALLLAGGRSRRLGRDKHLVDRHGVPALQALVDEFVSLHMTCFVALEPSRDFAGALTGAARWWDRDSGGGPLPVVLRALRRLREPLLVWAADRPLPGVKSLRTLWESDFEFACVAEVGGVLDPLAAVYRPAATEALAQFHASGQSSLRQFLEVQASSRLCRKKFALDEWPRDLDHPRDLSAVRQQAEVGP